jgi:hypothetical protein
MEGLKGLTPFCCWFRHRVPLHSLGWPRTHYVAQDCLNSWSSCCSPLITGITGCATMPSMTLFLFWQSSPCFWTVSFWRYPMSNHSGLALMVPHCQDKIPQMDYVSHIGEQVLDRLRVSANKTFFLANLEEVALRHLFLSNFFCSVGNFFKILFILYFCKMSTENS